MARVQKGTATRRSERRVRSGNLRGLQERVQDQQLRSDSSGTPRQRSTNPSGTGLDQTSGEEENIYPEYQLEDPENLLDHVKNVLQVSTISDGTSTVIKRIMECPNENVRTASFMVYMMESMNSLKEEIEKTKRTEKQSGINPSGTTLLDFEKVHILLT